LKERGAQISTEGGLSTVDNENDAYATASVRSDGGIWNRDDKEQGVARFQAGDRIFWFNWDITFDANGNDFWVVIKYFGFPVRDVAGNRDGLCRQRFTPMQAAAIRQRLSDYYWGDEDKIVFPFKHPGCRFLGICFEDNWILKR
jgi:hypothetical protein